MTAVPRAKRGVATGIVAALVLLAAHPAAAAGPGRGDTSGGRLLIVSLPGLTWAEVASHRLPAIEGFVDGAALADLAPRGVSPRSGPGDAYVTISAGARATTERAVDGQVLGLEEQSSGSQAGEIFTRRSGITPSGPFVSLSWPSLVRRNATQPYDAELGLLGDALADAGVRTSVIGNADGTDSIGPSYERQVGLALASSDGVVDAGALGKELLTDDASRPFGKRLDLVAVREHFADAWHRGPSAAGRVVLVEASDLARTMRYRPLVSTARYAEIRAQALDEADVLVDALLDEVDPTRDSVLLIAPYNLVGNRDLTAIALRTPTTEPGYLMSASTQRSGYLTLVDVGPTILDRFGLVRPVTMEGRPAEVVTSSAEGAARVQHLVELNEASRFRERLLTPTTLVVVLLLALVAAGMAVAIVGGRSPRWRSVLGLLALVDLALLPTSYLARAFPLEDLGIGFYWTILAGGSASIALLATWIGRRASASGVALMLVLALVSGVLAADVVTGSRLSLNAAFGYSPTGNSRLYGISNYAFGQVASAVCLLAAMVVGAAAAPRRRLLAIGLLAVTLLVLGVPTWGADVGGVLAFTPALLVFAALVYERRIKLRLVIAGGWATVVALIGFGMLDLARPPSQRAHLGRLFERIGDEGLGPLLSIVQRKLMANMAVSTSSFWVAALPIGAAVWILIARHPSRPLDHLHRGLPALRGGLAGALVAAVLGSLLNDSGAIVGGVAVLVLTASVSYLLMVHEDPVPSG